MTAKEFYESKGLCVTAIGDFWFTQMEEYAAMAWDASREYLPDKPMDYKSDPTLKYKSFKEWSGIDEMTTKGRIMKLSNFDCNGKPISTDIRQGDRVLYYENQANGFLTVRVGMMGVWDGEKVMFKDKDHTVVRNTNWLIKMNR